jgi:quinol-cytochrome oxidoreductase complex cytochrome b subunit
MFGSIGLLFFLPWLDTSRVRSCTFRPIYKWFVPLLVLDVLILGYCGAHSPDAVGPLGIPLIFVARLGTLYYFFHLVILLPVLGKIERPLPLPPSIADAVLASKKAG